MDLTTISMPSLLMRTHALLLHVVLIAAVVQNFKRHTRGKLVSISKARFTRPSMLKVRVVDSF